MGSARSSRRWSTAAWSTTALGALAAGAALAAPDLREPLTLAVAPLAAAAAVVGVVRHRPLARTTWRLVALMVALLGAALVLPSAAALGATARPAGEVVFAAGQVVAAVVVLGLVRRRPRAGPARRASRVEVLLIAVVLGLTAAQVVATTLPAGGGDVADVLVPSVNVTILGILLRFVVSRRGLTTSTHLFMAAGVAVSAYDTANASAAARVASPGEPVQALGLLCLALFAAAALHPSARVALSAEALGERRAPSVALLGLLPLVAVPVGLWWTGAATTGGGLPTGVFVGVGAVVAGLCLVRGSGAMRETEHLAEHDPLTDLLNRRGLARAFAERARSGPRGLVLVDVDDFKQVNDAHGHDVGDALLLEVRGRLLAAVGDDGVVARLGGDEFVALVPEAATARVVDRVLAALRRDAEIDGLAVRCSASLGVARSREGDALAQVLTRADVALYAAKAGGRDRAADFVPALQEAVADRLRTGVEVRRLLAGEPGTGELEVHFQPLVELATGRVVGAEALVRWRHPERGLVLPGGFLGAVSAGGLDAALDDAVLRQVVAQLARWRERGQDPAPVSVNLSRDSLVDPGLAARVEGRLRGSGVPARLLHVEVTEHQQLPDDAVVERNLARLSSAGVGVHLDDYGTGFTSLDYLHRFPVEVLKLDRAVTATSTSERRRVVAGIVAMSRTLELDVLAEGVETPEQRDALLELGVRYGQGWFFGRPEPAAAHAERVLRGRTGHVSAGHAATAAVVPRLPAPRATAPAPRATAPAPRAGA